MEYEVLGWPGDGVALDLDHRAFSYAGKFVVSNTGKAVARTGGGGRDGETDGDRETDLETAGEETDGGGATDRDGQTVGDRETGGWTTGGATGDDGERAADDDGATADDGATTGDAGNGSDGGAVVAAVAFDADRTDPATTWLRYVTVRADRRGEGLGPRLVRYVTSRVRDRGAERVRIAVNNPFAYEALYRAGFGFTGEETGVAELVLQRPGDRSAARYRAGLARFRGRDGLSDAELAFLADREGATPPDVVPVPE